ncbi:hypothetical protein MRB53_022081 [Persea americana]|uniref:Uncharacterized protein n=1 Tax=Persea americana TaxID=3435 RepID=A0ACC2L5X2_PERAE|nr:hypothetical protein MRB53_022081 [Persea americana]
MRGVGGPLLCIGDLLSDVAEGDSIDSESLSPPPPPPPLSSLSTSSTTNDTTQSLSPSHLHHLFEENYSQLKAALEGTDHSWTMLTIKLCAALETADKLIQTANSNVEKLSEELEALEEIMKRGDSAIATAKTIQNTWNKKDKPSTRK